MKIINNNETILFTCKFPQFVLLYLLQEVKPFLRLPNPGDVVQEKSFSPEIWNKL